MNIFHYLYNSPTFSCDPKEGLYLSTIPEATGELHLQGYSYIYFHREIALTRAIPEKGHTLR